MKCKVEEFVCLETNSIIKKLTDIGNEENVKFIGFTETVINTPQGKGRLPIQVELEADTIEKAFEILPKAIVRRIKEIEAEISEQSRIITPNGQPAGQKKNEEPLIFPGR